MEIQVLQTNNTKPLPDQSSLGFGRHAADHMFLMNFSLEKGWHAPRIVPYGPLSLDPMAMVLHYNQEVFEGLKAYCLQDGSTGLFRPEKNIERMNYSCQRMVMPELDPDLCFKAIKKLVLMDKHWVPESEGSSLYIRPTMIATEPGLGVRPSNEYLFFILTSPVGAYYSEGFGPTRIFVSDNYVRAAKGGVGQAKTSGNYGPTLLVSKQAAENGYTQVLWLDAEKRKYVEEVGTSNIFFLFKDELVTPPLDGTILPGITRDSVICLAEKWKLKVTERPVEIDEVIQGCKDKSLKEMFATGTAAVISPVGDIGYKGNDYTIADGSVGQLSQKLYDTLTGIQYGRLEDPFGWRVRLD